MYLRISIQSNECQDILVKSIDILEREKTISLGTEAKRTNDSYRQGKIQKWQAKPKAARQPAMAAKCHFPEKLATEAQFPVMAEQYRSDYAFPR